MNDYLKGVEAGLQDAKDGVDQLETILRYIDNEGITCNKDEFRKGYLIGQTNHNNKC